MSLFIICAFVLSANAQSDACDLELKFFEYDLKTAKITVSGLDLSIVNLSDDAKEKIKAESETYTFPNKKNGKYKVKLQKSGFKERIKEFKIDCEYADKNNIFAVNIYLFRKSNSSVKEKVSVKGNGNISPVNIGGDKPSEKSNTDTDDSDVVTTITVSVVIDVDGNIVSAEAGGGDPAFFERSVKAVRLIKFAPTFLSGMPVKVSGNIIYRYKK